MKLHLFSVVLLFFSLFAAKPPAVIEEFDAKVIKIIDGDTVVLQTAKESLKFRFLGINAPEENEKYYSESTKALSAIIFGQNVKVKKTGHDHKWDRMVGIIIHNGVNVNLKMIEDGWAGNQSYFNDDEQWAKAEEKAKSLKKGLWAELEKSYWLNTATNKRHNQKCVYYKNTVQGKSCMAKEGVPCGLCGG